MNDAATPPARHAGHAAVAQLQREGVDLLFSLNGGHVAHIYDATIDAGLPLVDVRHEDAAVHMAHAYARLSGKPGVAVVTAGPGVTNTATAIANAYEAASPLLLIGGKAPVPQFGLGALQDVDQVGLMRPITKAAFTVLEPDRVAEQIGAALRIAHTAPQGPVYVEVPTDVLRAPLPEDAPLTVAPGRLAPRPAPDPQALAAAVALLASAERPLIVAGGGVHWSDAFAALAGLAERLQAPVLTTSLTRGALAPDHPLSLPGARSALFAGADVVLVVGARFNYVLGYGRPPRFAAGTKIIQIDLAADELNRNRVADVAMLADARAALEALAAALPVAPARPWVTLARERHAKARDKLLAQIGNTAGPVHPLALASEVMRALPADATLVLDGGDILSWGRLVAEPAGPRRYLDSGPFGCLGVGVPFANAATYARPGTQAVCLTGDGALGFHLMEFDTAVRHKRPIVIVVSNNSAWGIERLAQIDDFGPSRVLGTELRDCRFDRLAQALGGHGERVDHAGELPAALRRALDAGVPAIVDVVTDRDAASPDLKRGLARVPDRAPLASYGSPPG